MIFVSNRVAVKDFIISEAGINSPYFPELWDDSRYNALYDLLRAIKRVIIEGELKIDNEIYKTSKKSEFFLYGNNDMDNTLVEKTTLALHNDYVTGYHRFIDEEANKNEIIDKENKEVFDLFNKLVTKDKYL